MARFRLIVSIVFRGLSWVGLLIIVVVVVVSVVVSISVSIVSLVGVEDVVLLLLMYRASSAVVTHGTYVLHTFPSFLYTRMGSCLGQHGCLLLT